MKAIAYGATALALAIIIPAVSGQPWGAKAASAPAAKGPSVAQRGHMVFERNCAPCHGTGPGIDGSPTLPATAILAQRYEGQMPGALELRTDLTADVLRLFVRQGAGGMPMFRKAEISDADIDAMAVWIAQNAKKNAGRKR